MDDYHTQSGSVQLPLHELQIHHGQKLEVEDMITNNCYNWYHEWNYVELQASLPFHIFKIRK